jgi:hypothetical protein
MSRADELLKQQMAQAERAHQTRLAEIQAETRAYLEAVSNGESVAEQIGDANEQEDAANRAVAQQQPDSGLTPSREELLAAPRLPITPTEKFVAAAASKRPTDEGIFNPEDMKNWREQRKGVIRSTQGYGVGLLGDLGE